MDEHSLCTLIKWMSSKMYGQPLVCALKYSEEIREQQYL